MATNTKPQLIVLIDEAKREQLRAFASGHRVSMGWLVNQLLDRLLSGEVDVLEDSSIAYREHLVNISIEEVEALVQSSISKSMESIVSVSIEEVKALVESSISKLIKPIEQQIIALNEQTKKPLESNPKGSKKVAENKNTDSKGITSAEIARKLGAGKSSVARWSKGGSISSDYQAQMEHWQFRDGLWHYIE